MSPSCPRCLAPTPLVVAAALLLLLLMCPGTSVAQKGKPAEPQCLGPDRRICNAVIHFPDKVIDQGRYCNGCANCTAPVGLGAANSFLWQHFEHARMRVQFLMCGEFRAERTCGPRDLKAAVFVSPRSAWEPALGQMYCRCPVTDQDAKVPVYHLINWHLEADQWVYEFGCKSAQCNVSAPVLLQKERLVGSVCARKRRVGADGPVDVNFVCACPPDFHCYVEDQEARSGEQGSGSGDGGGGGGGGGGGNDLADIELWLQALDETTGDYVFEKRQRCEKRVANQTSPAN